MIPGALDPLPYIYRASKINIWSLRPYYSPESDYGDTEEEQEKDIYDDEYEEEDDDYYDDDYSKCSKIFNKVWYFFIFIIASEILF